MTITRTYATTLDRIIAEEVLANASQMVSDLAAEGSHWADDMLDCISAPDYSGAPDGYSVKRVDDEDEGTMYNLLDADGIAIDGFSTKRDAIIAAWEDSGDEPDDIEALQHWIISDWLAGKLEEVGALVSRDILGFAIWGRTECGQGLDQDSDLIRVAELIDRQ